LPESAIIVGLVAFTHSYLTPLKNAMNVKIHLSLVATMQLLKSRIKTKKTLHINYI
jgi:hypothetical protein